jgi:hypothetical protein
MVSKTDALTHVRAGKLARMEVAGAVTTIEPRSVNVNNKWIFEQDDELRWRWVHRQDDAQQSQSAQSFQRPMDCVLDAVRHTVLRRRAMIDDEQAR